MGEVGEWGLQSRSGVGALGKREPPRQGWGEEGAGAGCQDSAGHIAQINWRHPLAQQALPQSVQRAACSVQYAACILLAHSRSAR